MLGFLKQDVFEATTNELIVVSNLQKRYKLVRRSRDEHGPFGNLPADLIALKAAAAKELSSPTLDRDNPILAGGPVYWWIVHRLSPIYENYFKRKPGTSRPSEGGKPYGPFVRFVQAVASEFDESVSAETIDAYLKKSRKRGGGAYLEPLA